MTINGECCWHSLYYSKPIIKSMEIIMEVIAYLGRYLLALFLISAVSGCAVTSLFNPYPESRSKRNFDWLPLSIRIHKIIKEDNDRHLHDHPSNARTFILKGWYKEERLNGFNTRKLGETSRLNFGEYHRITEVCEEGVYTLFVTGKYRGTWGFLVDGVKVKYREYLGLV